MFDVTIPLLERGLYRVRVAQSNDDEHACLSLRAEVFRQGANDRDPFDNRCMHVLVEEKSKGRLVCCFRLLQFNDGSEIDTSYAAQFYGLDALSAFEGRMVELGRFCVDPALCDPDILRVAWAGLTRLVDETGVKMLFGCSSFNGTDALTYQDAFALLRARHIAPSRWLPRVKAPDVFRFAHRESRALDLRRAQAITPPLLRTYLIMGGWVSDHAVIDHDLSTMHVFTGLEIAAIPPARKRLLRAL